MGLKSGSRDAGLDDADDEPQNETTANQHATLTNDRSIATDSDSTAADDGHGDAVGDAEPVSNRPTVESLPYTLRRDKVNEGREQVPYFLRAKIIDAEDDLQDTLEDLLGETVYKSDYREASMVVAQRHPELVAEVLREWGYDLDAT